MAVIAEPTDGVRVAELLASLSLAIDLGLGEPSEWMMRSALVAVRLAGAAGYDEETQRAAYYLGLIRMVGCTSTSFADAGLFGDELAMAELMTADFADPRTMGMFMRLVGRDRPPLIRSAMVARLMLAMGSGVFIDNHQRHCEAGAILAARIGLDTAVQAAIRHVYERWDGKGTPSKVAGEAIHPAMRAVHVAHVVGHYYALGGVEAALEVARQRSGSQFEPELVRVLAASADAVLAPVQGSMFDAVVAAEPGTPLWSAGADLDTALEAVADFADQKIPQTIGHSRRVAQLAGAAGRLSGLPPAEVDHVRRAGLVHDIGRVGVSAGILGKPGSLTPAEWERVRLHPYYTERVFASSAALQGLGKLGALHHERLDGTGYHRGLGAAMLDAPARLLAAANAYAALTEDRPHRPGLVPKDAIRTLREAATANRLDARAVEAVITAAGEKPKQVRRASSITLTEREVEVLRLVARQLSNKQIARELDISAKTVEHHVSHIFDKTGVTTRTGAALYATHHNLL
jgi:HD-GYP domain-containing protein (c-di-GMP phosphodiesterase class II)